MCLCKTRESKHVCPLAKIFHSNMQLQYLVHFPSNDLVQDAIIHFLRRVLNVVGQIICEHVSPVQEKGNHCGQGRGRMGGEGLEMASRSHGWIAAAPVSWPPLLTIFAARYFSYTWYNPEAFPGLASPLGPRLLGLVYDTQCDRRVECKQDMRRYEQHALTSTDLWQLLEMRPPVLYKPLKIEESPPSCQMIKKGPGKSGQRYRFVSYPKVLVMDPNIAIVSAADDDFIESQIIPTLKPQRFDSFFSINTREKNKYVTYLYAVNERHAFAPTPRGLHIRNCTGSCNSSVPWCAKISARVWQLRQSLSVCIWFQDSFHLSPESTVPMHLHPHSWIASYFLISVQSQWPLVFLVITILQVICPVAGGTALLV